MKTIVIKKDELGIEISDLGNVFIEKRKFGSDNNYTIQLSVEELEQILKAVKDNQ